MTTKQRLDINYLLDVWPSDHEVSDSHGHNTKDCPICREVIRRGHKLWNTNKVKEKTIRADMIAKLTAKKFTPDEIAERLNIEKDTVNKIGRLNKLPYWRKRETFALWRDKQSERFKSIHEMAVFLHASESDVVYCNKKHQELNGWAVIINKQLIEVSR
ncbi:hypothetical protein [Paucilactobacillus kaifaensis]|uniref:hypothetical protein n=1 Tax=Paucilactobacillus kaifaensis TaxID=2559921 RepID=UPI0010F4D257|nr:hypothetical protein [Paucilactobacillus kaifaensis]